MQLKWSHWEYVMFVCVRREAGTATPPAPNMAPPPIAESPHSNVGFPV